MTDPAVAAAARAAAHPIQRIGSVWMLHPEQFEASTKAGYEHPYAGYLAGRAGLLGDTSATVVDAVLGILGPGLAAKFWPMAVRPHGARGGAELYFAQAADWGRSRFADAPGTARFVELGEKVLAAAPTTGLPLFAVQVTLPRASDAPGRALQVAVLLRELRFGLHLAAMTAVGLPMLEAHLLNQGAEYARMLGWSEPFPPADGYQERKRAAEDLTDAREAEIWAKALPVAEAEELAALATALYEPLRTEDPLLSP